MDTFDNVFVLNTWFPKNVIFSEILYVDDSNKTSVNLMRKYGIKYFKCKKVFYKPGLTGIALVVAQIKRKEETLWKKVMNDLIIMNPSKEYRDVCVEIKDHLKNHIIEK